MMARWEGLTKGDWLLAVCEYGSGREEFVSEVKPSRPRSPSTDKSADAAQGELAAEEA